MGAGYNLNKWFGVNGSCEFMSIVIGVRGLELVIDFASRKNVCNWLWFNSFRPVLLSRRKLLKLFYFTELLTTQKHLKKKKIIFLHPQT